MLSEVLTVLRIVSLVPAAELHRRFAPMSRCVVHFRARGRRQATRSVDQRIRLRRLIHAIDVRLPDGGNCYRRALIEMALDPTSAAEPLHFGLVRHGGPKSGHAWLGCDLTASKSYDAEFTI
jgi:hypothetical protein